MMRRFLGKGALPLAALVSALATGLLAVSLARVPPDWWTDASSPGTRWMGSWSRPRWPR